MRSPSESAATVQTSTVDLRSAPALEPPIRRFWPPAMIALGLGLTAAWVGLLGYALVKLIGLAI